MILFQTSKMILRDIEIRDAEAFLRWQTNGEWRYLDAPWEGILHAMSREQETAFRTRFLDERLKPLPKPRKSAVINLYSVGPIGFVNRYGEERFPDVYYLGISICDDEHLNHGLGTIALHGWVDYLFENSPVHKLEVHTWSLNPRMMHLAEKIGFQHEGTERELVEWQGERHDRIRYGMLRMEWEQAKSVE